MPSFFSENDFDDDDEEDDEDGERLFALMMTSVTAAADSEVAGRRGHNRSRLSRRTLECRLLESAHCFLALRAQRKWSHVAEMCAERFRYST